MKVYQKQSTLISTKRPIKLVERKVSWLSRLIQALEQTIKIINIRMQVSQQQTSQSQRLNPLQQIITDR